MAESPRTTATALSDASPIRGPSVSTWQASRPEVVTGATSGQSPVVMRIGIALVAGLSVVLLGASAASVGPGTTRPMVLEHVAVIDGTGADLESDMTIVIEDGRITALGPSGKVRLPNDADVRSLPGHFAMPGLIDVHAHARAAWVMESLLAYGVTSIRNPSSSRAGGTDFAAEVNSGRLAGPTVVTAGPIIDAPPRRTGRGPLVTTPDEMRQAVRQQAADGVQWIKLYVNVTAPLVEAAVDEARRHGLRVGGDLVATSWVDGARLGIDVISHLASRDPELLPVRYRDDYRQLVSAPESNRLWQIVQWLEWIDPEGDEVRKAARAMAATGVAVDPTLVVLEAIILHADSAYRRSIDASRVPTQVAQSWTTAWNVPFPADYVARRSGIRANSLRLARTLHDAGVPLLAGTDTPLPWVPPGASLHRELELLVEAGIPPLDVIRIATSNAARSLGVDSLRGTVQVGLQADLLVLRENPLEDIRSTRAIHCVLKAGREVRVAGLRPC